MNQFSNSFLSSLTAAQVSKVPAPAFYRFHYSSLLRTDGPLQAISPLMFTAIYNSSDSGLGCDVLSSLSVFQLEFFRSEFCINHSWCLIDSRIDCSTAQRNSRQTSARPFDTQFYGRDATGLCHVPDDFTYAENGNDNFESCHTSSSSSSSSGGSSSSHAGVIAAAVIVPVLVIAGVAGAYWWFVRYQQFIHMNPFDT